VTESHDPKSAWVVEESTCNACRAMATVNRDFEAKHKDHKPTTGRPSPGDGRVSYVRPYEQDKKR
jgi:hypothetical protein